MRYRISIGLIVAAALAMTIAGARAFDDAKYPDWKGQWLRPPRSVLPRWDQTGKEAPLTDEYRAIFEANLEDMRRGGHGTEPAWTCLSPGMPRIMNVYEPMEIVVTPDETHILISHIDDNRRIFTDGRDWPADIEPSFAGYSIGRWIDQDGGGRYDALEVETRGFKGPRAYDTTGLPLHRDNQTIVKERIALDKADPNTLYDEITTFDHALTRPWTVTKTLHRSPEPQPVWLEENCAENNPHVHIGSENYFIGADGLLMPAKKDQTPPDLKYFNRSRK